MVKICDACMAEGHTPGNALTFRFAFEAQVATVPFDANAIYHHADLCSTHKHQLFKMLELFFGGLRE